MRTRNLTLKSILAALILCTFGCGVVGWGATGPITYEPGRDGYYRPRAVDAVPVEPAPVEPARIVHPRISRAPTMAHAFDRIKDSK